MTPKVHTIICRGGGGHKTVILAFKISDSLVMNLLYHYEALKFAMTKHS